MAFSWNSSTTISSEISTTSLPDRVNLGPFDREVDQMRLLGYPGPVFWIIHITALICLSLSMIVSVILIMFLCLPSRTRPIVSPEATVTVYTTKLNRDVPEKSHQTTGSFWKWSLSERLVIYLATSDLSYGVSHIMGSRVLPLQAIQSSGSTVFLLRLHARRVHPCRMDHRRLHGSQRVQFDRLQPEDQPGENGLPTSLRCLWSATDRDFDSGWTRTSRTEWSMVVYYW